MNVYTRLVNSVVFPLQERLKRHTTVAVKRRMEITQWWNPDQVRAYQLERLKALLRYAHSHVPFYRERFATVNFDPESVTALEDIQRLPLLTKADFRAHGDAFKSDRAQHLIRMNTGGSSGEPMIFFLSDERVSHDVAAKWRATRWWDVDIGDPEIVVWGSPIELGTQDRVKNLRDVVFRTKLLPAFEMSEKKLSEFVDEIRARRPRMLFGYPSALSKIADFARARNQRMDDLGVRVAFCTAEKLYEEQRANIAKTFGCRVANGYGGRDAGFVAHECPAGGLHITAEDMLIETVDSDGLPSHPGHPGEIVVTHFASKDFPFIRYRTGDVGVLDDKRCSCGRGLPLLKEVQGRTTDFVVAADGTVMHGLALIYVLRDMPGIRQFKILQESLVQTNVLLVEEPGFPVDGENTIVTEFRRRLGSSVQVTIERVEHIPPERSGKYRYVVSKVAA